MEDIEQNSGPNLKIPKDINNISKESEDLLRRILEKDPWLRISWDEFFCHPLFNENKQYNLNEGAAVNLRLKNLGAVDKRFLQSKIIEIEQKIPKVNPEPTKENNDIEIIPNDKNNTYDEKLREVTAILLNQVKDVKSYKEEKEINKDERDAFIKQNQENDVLKENSEFYMYEKKKIMHIWLTIARILICTKYIPQHKAVPQLNFLCLLLARKAQIFVECNLISIQKKNNVWNLKMWDKWVESPSAKQTEEEYQHDLTQWEMRYLKLEHTCLQLKTSLIPEYQSLLMMLRNEMLNNLKGPLDNFFGVLKYMVTDIDITFQKREFRRHLYVALIYTNYSLQLPDKWKYVKGKLSDIVGTWNRIDSDSYENLECYVKMIKKM